MSKVTGSSQVDQSFSHNLTVIRKMTAGGSLCMCVPGVEQSEQELLVLLLSQLLCSMIRFLCTQKHVVLQKGPRCEARSFLVPLRWQVTCGVTDKQICVSVKQQAGLCIGSLVEPALPLAVALNLPQPLFSPLPAPTPSGTEEANLMLGQESCTLPPGLSPP